jgi:hypothetical protein
MFVTNKCSQTSITTSSYTHVGSTRGLKKLARKWKIFI